MDDKVRLLLEALENELREQGMNATADEVIARDKGRLFAAHACHRAAEERRSKADAVKAAVDENAKLVKALRWTVRYIADGTTIGEAPTHYCGYVNEPLSGYCGFCDKYTTACELAFPEEFNGEEDAE